MSPGSWLSSAESVPNLKDLPKGPSRFLTPQNPPSFGEIGVETLRHIEGGQPGTASRQQPPLTHRKSRKVSRYYYRHQTLHPHLKRNVLYSSIKREKSRSNEKIFIKRGNYLSREKCHFSFLDVEVRCAASFQMWESRYSRLLDTVMSPYS